MPFSSPYRHIYGDVPKADFHYQSIKSPYTSGEGSYCAANTKYFAVSKSGGGGPVYVHPLDKPGRDEPKMVNVQKGKVLDFDFHPFIDSIIATASEDASVAITKIPDDMPRTWTTPELMLKGHRKKAQLMKWHPTANNILVSTSWDDTVKLWNAEIGEEVSTFQLGDKAFSMDFSADGSQLALTTKDHQMKIIDPRVGQVVQQWECMEGKKSSKLFWVDNFGYIGATGFTKQAKRQMKLWDLKNTASPIFVNTIDQQASVLMTKYDPDTNVLFTAGKGDGSVAFYQIIKGDKIVYNLGTYRDTTPQKGGGWVPKRALNTQKCEVMRFMKLTRDSVVPVSFVVPRKTGADIFQADIFPDTYAGLPSMSADEYLGGENKMPVTMSMDPEKRNDVEKVEYVKKKTYAELSQENVDLKAQIAQLEEKLKALGGTEAIAE